MIRPMLNRITCHCPWTLVFAGLMLLLNLALFTEMPNPLDAVITALQFDRAEILDGQIWRLMTGNLVHWSKEHFLLDIGAFLLVGILCERSLGKSYPWMLATAGLCVGVAVLVLQPEMSTYRGLSGVDSGQFAAALCAEFRRSKKVKGDWWFVAPAAVIFLIKLVYESMTGQMFFGTESLGDLGQPIPLAHVAGAIGGLIFVCIVAVKEQRSLLSPPRLVANSAVNP